MKKLLLSICLAVAALFAFSTAEVQAQHRHGGHRGHGHHGHGHHGHHGHHHRGHLHSGFHAGYQIAPRYVYRPYSVYNSYPVHGGYPVYRSYNYGYYPYRSSSLYIGGRNFSFGISGY